MEENNEHAATPVDQNPGPERNFFDHVGDFFARMILGIFIFIFLKVPCKIWAIISDLERLKRILRYSCSIIRALVLCMIWIALVFFGWWYFLTEQFLRFWQKVWDVLCNFLSDFLEFLHANAGPIWMILALCGSVYGLLYVTMKKRAKKKGKEFRGVFGFLKKKKSDDKAQNDPVVPPSPDNDMKEKV